MDLKQALKSELTRKELTMLPRSFDVVGSRDKAVAIVEIRSELKDKEKIIAKTLIKLNRNIKSVLKKISEREDIFRLRKYKLLAGDRNTEVMHKEFGCILKVDPRKVYFSPRESTERLRVAKQVRGKETVLVMFSGVAPYAIAVAKFNPGAMVYCIELNPAAHKYAIENVKLNKMEERITLLVGNVTDVCKKLKMKFDRVVMPLPRGAYQFLQTAMSLTKKNGIVHFYHWAHEDDLFSEAVKLIKEEAKKQGKKTRVLKKRKVLPYGPRKWKVVLDFKIL